jgi:hypothetical protein
MKIEVVHVSRRPQWPLWAVFIVLAWLGVGVVSLLLSAHLNKPVLLCLLKRLTGVACPTCGFTRGALSLLSGQFGRAWLYNPLLYSVFALFFIATAMRVFFARGIQIHLTRTERSIAWVSALVLFFANWAYVIFCVG